MIYVTHIKRNKNAEYIGRFNPSIDKPESPLHNPFKLQKYQARGSTIEKFEAYLDQKIADKDELVMNELHRLAGIARQRDLYLGCWCSPQPCHGDIIRAKIIQLMEESTMTKKVAIIGSRDLNEEQLAYVTSIAERFVRIGWEVSTGCADGADYAAMVGARNVDPTKLNVFLPWEKYNASYQRPTDNTTVFNPKKHSHWADSVLEHHPNPDKLTQGAFKLHARNYGILEDVDVCVAYPPSMKKVGGTGQGIRIAMELGTPLYVVCEEEQRDELDEYLTKLESVANAKSDFNITVAATQKFTDYALFELKCMNILGKLQHTRNIVVHAKCGQHVTELAEQLCEQHGFTLRKTAHKNPHGLIAFHDNKSKIVGKQIEIAEKAGIQIRVINYEKYLSSTKHD